MKVKIWGSVLVFFLLLTTKAFTQDVLQQTDVQKNRTQYTIKNVLPFYKEKAEQGDADAQMMMGQIYAMGDIVQADTKQAFFWYMKAAEQNKAEAQFKIAEMYLYGQGVERDFSYAEKWAVESAKQGYADSEYLLGLLYAEGKGVPKDWQKATIWLCRAANKGNQQAIELLESRSLSGKKSSTQESDGIKDWCNCHSGRLSDCR